MNILVTGGLGFIGSNFCNNIINKVNKLIIIDKLDYCSNLNNLNILEDKKLTLIINDLCKLNLTQIFIDNNIDTIIHFAAQTHVDNSYQSINKFINDNIYVVNYLLESLKNYSKHINNNFRLKIILMSTDEIYGPSLTTELTETSNFNPTNPYAATKASGEMIANSYKYSYNLPIIIIRCNNVYGENQYPEKVIPKFITQVLNNQSLTIHGDGNKIRDFIYITDVINAINIIIEKGIIGEIYNIGNDCPKKITDIAKDILNYFKKEINNNISFIEDRPFNDNRYYINSVKLKQLGWSPKITWEVGLLNIISFFKKEYENKYEKEKLTIKSQSINSFKDHRGELKFIGDKEFISYNEKNVLRGIHCSPYGKTVTVLKGSIEDYVVNIKMLKYQSLTLKENDKIYIPAGYGHLFVSLEDNTQVLYQLDDIYDENKEININYKDPYINLKLPLFNDFIISDKDLKHPFTKPIDYIVLGSTGFLGSFIIKYLDKYKKNYIKLNTRLENINDLENQLKLYKPKYVINAAGISGKPNVKWCENNKEITYNINYTLQIQLAKLCNSLNIHLTILGSGLIYKGNGLYTENDIGNIEDIYYSKLRIMLEKEIINYNNVLYLRIIYPLSGDKHNKCLLSKLLLNLDNIHDRKINVTCVSMFDILPNMIENNETGIFNFVNKGVIKISDLLKIYDSNLEPNVIKSEIGEPELSIEKLESKYKIENVTLAIKNLI